MSLKATLHPYQEYSKNFILDHPYCALLLDMGLGKTLSSLTAIDELLHTFEIIENVLVIAPLSVAEKTWTDEIEKWDHLQHLTFSKVLGNPKQREEALFKKADVYLINRENVEWLVNYYQRNWPFKTVIIDELSSFKSSSAKRFKALRKVRPKMERVIGLTGTPSPNSLMDLWAQMYLLDQGERLGKTITQYRNKYFAPAQKNGHIVYSWQLIPGAEEAIYNKISDICVSMKAKDYLQLPPRTENIIELDLNPTSWKQYKELEREYVLELEETDVVASNAATLSNKLLQLSNGAVYDENGDGREIHQEKLNALERVIEDAQGQSVLVFYQYQHDLERIQARFKQAKALNVSDGDIEKWNEGKIPLLLAHPQSAGHGLNLQKGGHIIVWFGLTWSLEFYQQANARLDRQGQTQPVIIHHLVTKGTIDEQVIKALQAKEQGQSALMAAVKAKIEEYRR
ncbi:DEAD/DEAH box helicase [Enterococcus faecalis]|uniref:DEAD/DEAH box helicase n=15 Tax=Bacteria TaxID=2 RepID=A0ABD7XNK8_ENTFL|nr:DEAD/DEAH box helicase [Enterococcus faecalis]EEI10369.1 SNF2 family N-terminal domain protein [Enterococcus faecalis TX0104]EFU86253.1 SNF2 family N-terminal domain protein [Enterococcus faecalis TX0309B]EFU94198.1 SNF2 family N-terminal domain protein [Enterococcus faecalis TX0309A]EGO2507185.1 DEAD/DEAH box helicase [Enterococcus faecalis]EJU85855.1 protein, SNF2 family [Enterococcus faecalis ERV103]